MQSRVERARLAADVHSNSFTLEHAIALPARWFYIYVKDAVNTCDQTGHNCRPSIGWNSSNGSQNVWQKAALRKASLKSTNANFYSTITLT